MPGFRSIINKNQLKAGFSKCDDIGLVFNEINFNNIQIQQLTLNKFLNDKVLFENEKYILLIEGVILNSLKLIKKYNAPDFKTALMLSYEMNGETFFNELRGSFSGFLYDKALGMTLVFTNHTGDKQVFYSTEEGSIFIGSEMQWLVDVRKNNKLPVSLNQDATNMILTYGFLLETHTLVKEIKKLQAGHYLKIHGAKIEEIMYHRFRNDADHTKTYDEWIEGIDEHFRNAVRLQFEKDIEYGYKHITTLSGGLDSRMTVWVAHQLGYMDQTNTTFSQSGYLDETIAKKIATDLKHEWIFKALDHGNFIKDPDKITRFTCGAADYTGLAHGYSLYEYLDFSEFGIMHTGQIGDAIIGTFYPTPVAGTLFNLGDGAHSTTIIEKLSDYKFSGNYPNIEIFKLYTRAFTGANTGLLAFQQKTETCSPFLDVEFLEYCYSIPVEYRFAHKIYFDWIFKKYPEAAAYPWERIKGFIKPVKPQQYVYFLGKKVPKDKFFLWLKTAIVRRIPFANSKKSKDQPDSYHMNPFEYWFKTNSSLNLSLGKFYDDNIGLILDEQLNKDCNFLYNSGNITDKLHVITLLSACKQLFHD